MNTPEPNIPIEWVLVTPQLAAEWLKRNDCNRRPRERTIAKYATDMRSGDWVPEAADPIRRAPDGTLLDGQHRLMAVIEAGVSIWMLVVNDVDPSAQAVMDTGMNRNYADQIRMKGKQNHTTLAAVLRWVVLWERGERIIAGTVPPTHKEMETALAAYPELENSTHFAVVAARQLRLPPAVFAMAHWLFGRLDKAEANWFLSRVADGTELTADHPAYAFRERVRRDREARRKVPNHVHLALLTIAWNAYRDQRPLTKLQLPKSGLTSGNYPIAR